MNTLDRVIAWFSPRLGYQRETYRRGIAGYKAAKESRLQSVIREGRDPNSPVQADAIALRERARTLEQDDPIARHALDILVNKTIGTGLIPEPMVLRENGEPFTELNEQISEAYEVWSENPEATYSHDAVDAQRIAARTFFRDGEVFLQHIEGNVRNYRHGSNIPYSFELIEPDLLPFDLTEPGIAQGIAINGWRQPQAYFFWSDYYNSANQFLLPRTRNIRNATIRVDAALIEHLALRDRINQLRGVSLFASTILRFGDIAEIEESERVAARVAAAMCAVIVKGNADNFTGSGAGDEDRQLKFKPGMVFDDLMPGERVESMASNRPNNEVISFRDSQLRAAAGGMGVTYSTLANDYNGTYSSQRQELVEGEVAYDVLSRYFCRRMEKPKYQRFLTAAIASGWIERSAIREADLDTLNKAWWATPAMPWVDPSKEMDAIEKSVNIGLTSLSRAQRERGLSPREVFRERAMEQAVESEIMPAPAQEEPEETVEAKVRRLNA